MNIDGMSEATLEKLMAHGMIHSYADLFRLDRFEEQIKSLDGFGQKSYDKLNTAVQNARKTTLSRFLYGLGIPGIGVATARQICRALGEDLETLRSADAEKLSSVEGIGAVLGAAWEKWWNDPVHAGTVDEILPYLEFEKEYAKAGARRLAGKTFVITGSVTHFANRKELQALIEQEGGHAAGSVSAKTDYLINNDVNSGSSKNRKARELGIPILSEEDFLAMLGETPQQS